MSAKRLELSRDAWGPLIGAGLGLFVFKKTSFALVGAALGYVVQQRLRARRSIARPKAAPADAALLTSASDQARLFALLATHDGELDPPARSAIYSWFAVDLAAPADDLAVVAHAMNTAVSQTTLRAAAAELDATHRLGPRARSRILFAAFRVALSRPLTNARETALCELAAGLGIRKGEYDTLRADFVPSRRSGAAESDYATIGAAPYASFESARDAYRDAVRASHPDRFAHLGAAEAAAAGERFKAIQRAWERIAREAELEPPPRKARCPNCSKFTAYDEAECIRCAHPKFEGVGKDRTLGCAGCPARTPLSDLGDRGVGRCRNCAMVIVL